MIRLTQGAGPPDILTLFAVFLSSLRMDGCIETHHDVFHHSYLHHHIIIYSETGSLI